eukprot:PhF_6_TR15981/c1_g1_i2/m.25035
MSQGPPQQCQQCRQYKPGRVDLTDQKYYCNQCWGRFNQLQHLKRGGNQNPHPGNRRHQPQRPHHHQHQNQHQHQQQMVCVPFSSEDTLTLVDMEGIATKPEPFSDDNYKLLLRALQVHDSPRVFLLAVKISIARMELGDPAMTSSGTSYGCLEMRDEHHHAVVLKHCEAVIKFYTTALNKMARNEPLHRSCQRFLDAAAKDTTGPAATLKEGLGALNQLLTDCKAMMPTTTVVSTTTNRHTPTPFRREYLNYKSVTVLPNQRDFDFENPKDYMLRRLPCVVVDSPIESLVQHVATLFYLTREDFVASLREGVRQYLYPPPKSADRKYRQRDVRVYPVVRFQHMETSEQNGLVFQFQLDMKQCFPSKNYVINWSKRLNKGNVVMVHSEGFSPQSTAPIFCGTVCRLPYYSKDSRGPDPVTQGLFQISFASATFDFSKHLCGNKNQQFCMVESCAFFLTYERTLRNIQTLEIEKLPESILTALQYGRTEPPGYVARNRGAVQIRKVIQLETDGEVFDVMDAALWKRNCATWSIESEEKLQGQHVLHVLDDTQLDAMHHILTNNVAVVQGTPGTGKTFVGAKFVQLLLNNWHTFHLTEPIFVLCYTNHAIDSFLKDLLKAGIDPDCMGRFGSNDKVDPEVKALNLYDRFREYRRRNYNHRSELEKIAKEIKELTDHRILATKFLDGAAETSSRATEEVTLDLQDLLLKRLRYPICDLVHEHCQRKNLEKTVLTSKCTGLQRELLRLDNDIRKHEAYLQQNFENQTVEALEQNQAEVQQKITNLETNLATFTPEIRSLVYSRESLNDCYARLEDELRVVHLELYKNKQRMSSLEGEIVRCTDQVKSFSNQDKRCQSAKNESLLKQALGSFPSVEALHFEIKKMETKLTQNQQRKVSLTELIQRQTEKMNGFQSEL